MYNQEVPRITHHAYHGQNGLYDVIEFALLTIRRPLSQVGSAKDQLRKVGLDNAKLASVTKKGLLWSKNYEGVLRCQLLQCSSVEEAMLNLINIPGIGLAKSAFICQMLGFPVGCLDVHNLREGGIKEPTMNKSGGLTHKKNAIKRYVSLSNNKTSEQWWDDWCKLVAGNRWNSYLKPCEEVSQYHYKVITQ
jgi:hypothetical protein